MTQQLLPRSMLSRGASLSPCGLPSKYEASVQRLIKRPVIDVSRDTGSSRTPLHRLNGIITPSGLHFERYHNGVPDIDPITDQLLIHGLVRRPLTFTIDALLRYPTISRIYFIECG